MLTQIWKLPPRRPYLLHPSLTTLPSLYTSLYTSPFPSLSALILYFSCNLIQDLVRWSVLDLRPTGKNVGRISRSTFSSFIPPVKGIFVIEADWTRVELWWNYPFVVGRCDATVWKTSVGFHGEYTSFKERNYYSNGFWNAWPMVFTRVFRQYSQ